MPEEDDSDDNAAAEDWDELARREERGPKKHEIAQARKKAEAAALRFEEAARAQQLPLYTQPYEPSLWPRPLPVAPHVLYSALPPGRPSGGAMFGWIPDGWAADAAAAAAAASAARAPSAASGGRARAKAPRRAAVDVVCTACGTGDDSNGNEILLCDGKGCEIAMHMQCLDPPLQQVPKGKWRCTDCAAAHSAQLEARRQARRARAEETAGPPSEYELQRMQNIARNQQVLSDLGLGT